MANHLGIYHRADNDGFCCAAIMKYKFNDDIELVGYNYGEPIKEILELAEGKDVIMADVSFTWEQMFELKSVCKSLVLVDHHKSVWEKFIAKEEFCGEINYTDGSTGASFLNKQNHLSFFFVYEEDVSASEILWKFLSKEKEYAEEMMPTVISLIGVYDTGRECVFTEGPTYFGKKAKWLSFGLRIYKDKIEEIQQCLDDSNYLSEIIGKGKAILEYEKIQSEAVGRSCTQIIDFDGVKVAIANTTTDPSVFVPEGEYEFICCYYKKSDGKWKYSLRPGNNQDNCPDLSKIAQIYGGDGHAKAAGFIHDSNIFDD